MVEIKLDMEKYCAIFMNNLIMCVTKCNVCVFIKNAVERRDKNWKVNDE